MNWIIPVGLGVLAAAVVLATREEKKPTIRIDPSSFRARFPQNNNPLVRYTGPFVQLSPLPQSGSAPKQGGY